MARKRSLMGWIFRFGLYGVFLIVLAGGIAAGAYYAGFRLPVYSDLTSFVLKNWNQTRDVAFDADYDSSLKRQEDRMHFTVDLRLPEAVQRLQAYMDGGRTMLLDCGVQKVFIYQLQNANLSVNGPVIGISGQVDLEMEGLLQVREGRGVAASVRTGHDRTTIWAQVDSLQIEGLPDPMVEPLLKEMSRYAYTREQVLDLAADSLSPELAQLLKTHRDALDLGFERITPAKVADALTLEAEFSIDESAAISMLTDHFAEAGADRATKLAAMFGPAQARAQGLGGILDGITREAEKVLQEGGAQGGLEDIVGSLTKLTDCRTAF